MSDYAEKKCASCPTIFKPGGPRAKYCDECTSRPRVAAGTKKTKRRLALVAASKKLPTRVTEVFSDAPSSPMDRARNFFGGMKNIRAELVEHRTQLLNEVVEVEALIRQLPGGESALKPRAIDEVRRQRISDDAALARPGAE